MPRDTRATFEGPVLAALPDVSSVGSWRLTVDGAGIQFSQNGGPYANIPAGGAASGWTDLGAVVELTNPADQVTMSADSAAPAAGIKVRIQDSPALAGNAPLEVRADGDISLSSCINFRRPRSVDLPAFNIPSFCDYLIQGRPGDSINSSQFMHIGTLDAANPYPGVAGVILLIGDPANGEEFEQTIVTQDSRIEIFSAASGAGLGTFPVTISAANGFGGVDPGSPLRLQPGQGVGGGVNGNLEVGWLGVQPAGQDSPIINLEGAAAGPTVVNVGVFCEADVGDVRKRLCVNDDVVGRFFRIEADATSAPNRIRQQVSASNIAPYQIEDQVSGDRAFFYDGVSLVAVHDGPGMAAIARVGQITDNSTGVSGGAVAAVAGTGDDATINNNNATMLSRINALEAQAAAFGWFV